MRRPQPCLPPVEEARVDPNAAPWRSLDAEAPAAEEPPPSQGGIPLPAVAAAAGAVVLAVAAFFLAMGSGGGSLVVAGGAALAERIGRRRAPTWGAFGARGGDRRGGHTPGRLPPPGRHPDRRPGRCRRWLQPSGRRRSRQSRPEPRGAARRWRPGAGSLARRCRGGGRYGRSGRPAERSPAGRAASWT